MQQQARKHKNKPKNILTNVKTQQQEQIHQENQNHHKLKIERLGPFWTSHARCSLATAGINLGDWGKQRN